MTWHSVGDDHAVFGWRRVPVRGSRITTHHLQSWTMHRAARDGIPTEKMDLKDGDFLILSFGELDCRTNIYKYVDENTTYRDIIDEITARYGKELLRLREQHPNVNICVYNVPPPARAEYVTKNPNYPAFPFNSTNEERKQYALYMNAKLREFCNTHNFEFIDIYDKCTDKDGFLNLSVADSSKAHMDRASLLWNWARQHFKQNKD